MNVIRALIVDDEELARESLKLALKKFDQIIIIDECANGFEAIKSVQENQPDVIFLDIQMPKINGFDVVELLGRETPNIIFVTAYDEYAIKAFETNALDYLLKPVNAGRLQVAIDRLSEKLSLQAKTDYRPLLDQARANQSPDRILVKEKARVQVIPVGDISHIEAQGDYIVIYTNKDKYLKNERISILEKQLNPQVFIRLHRSFLVNVDYIDRIESYSKDSKLVKLRNGAEVPVSRSGYEKLKQVL
ncbi:MAG: LytTR family transcriptional regulator DNA-binding domain-containing protein [Calditrichaceae bacterium]